MADDYVRRTAITRLCVSAEQRELLEDTISEWKRGCQIATDIAWGTCCGKRDVHTAESGTVLGVDLGIENLVEIQRKLFFIVAELLRLVW